MKRLTRRTDNGDAWYNHRPDKTVYNSELLQRLAYYEDMEEQGRLVVLPCKVGDTVYVTGARFYLGKEHTGIQKGTVYGYELNEGYGWVIWAHMEGETYSGNAYCFSDFGKTVFLTREEAERALKGGAN